MKEQLKEIGILNAYQLAKGMQSNDSKCSLSLTTCQKIFDGKKVGVTSLYKLNQFINKFNNK